MTAPYRVATAALALPRAPTTRHRACARCEDWVIPLRPHPGWRVAEVSSWVFCAAMLLPASKGPWMVLMPLHLLMTVGFFGPLRARSKAEPRCPRCARYVAE